MSKLRDLALLGAILLTIIPIKESKAIPAKPGVHAVKNSDGSTVSFELHGDERMHYKRTKDGFVITADEKGNYVYLTKGKDGNILKSSIIARDNETLSSQLGKDDSGVFIKDIETSNTLSRVYKKRDEMRITSPMSTKGKKKGIVLLVEFSDIKFRIPSPQVEFSNMLNVQGYTNSYGQIGSAKDYFRDISMNQFDPEFLVLGPIALPNSLSSYGGNGTEGYDKDPARMVYDALKLADLSSVNMSELDDNNDGFADNLFVFYAGYSEAEGGPEESIWPHAASLKMLLSLTDNMLPQKDGVKFNDYACGSELADKDGSRMSGIGAFCHEFSHILGLPDTYDTDYSTNGQAFGLDAWSLMANGPYNGNGNIPPSLNAWERWKSGWLTLTELSEADDYELEPLQESNQGYILKSEANNKEYFILENRQQTLWDRALPGHGMLIYHLDFTSTTPWLNNQVNATASRQCFELETADAIQTKATLSGDPYPGTSNKKEFTDVTTPSSRLWSGHSLGKPITDISEKDGIIEFKLSGGFILSSPSNISADNIQENSFELNWKEVERASNYFLDVYTEKSIDNGIVTKLWGFNNGTIDSELSPSASFSANFDTFGETAPSMSATNTSRDISTPNYGFALNYFSFWYNVDNNNTEWAIKLEAFANGSWTIFETINHLNAKLNSKYETNTLPESTLRVRVSWTRGASANKFSIDDISVRYHEQSVDRTYIEGYNNKELGNITNHQVIGVTGSTTYTCVLRSANSSSVSSNSTPIEVITSESTSLDQSELNQIRVYRGANNTITIENRSNKSVDATIIHTTGTIVRREFIEIGEQHITLPKGSIYIVQVGEKCFKIAL